MSKYDQLVETNKKRSREKEVLAQNAITQLLKEDIQITIAELVRRTGLSRGYFYKNEGIKQLFDRAVSQQKERPQVRKQNIINHSMEKHIQKLEAQVNKLREESQNLKQENEKLRKALGQYDLERIRGM